MYNDTRQRVVIERMITRALREQPLRTAPGTLEARVFAAIAARQSAPWWRQSYQNWPKGPQVAFMLLSAGFIWLGVELAQLVTSLFGTMEAEAAATTLAPGIAWTRAAVDLTAAMNEAFRATAAGIPELWLYGAGLVVAALYALFFSLGAVGYRAFQLAR